jgi:glycosyltransferase involved in cell wall biosynthesis
LRCQPVTRRRRCHRRDHCRLRAAGCALHYAQRDARFTAIAGAGEGAARARNLGINAARGQWLHFLDADDRTDPDCFEKLLAALALYSNAVAAFCGYRRVMPGGARFLLARALALPYSLDGSSAGLNKRSERHK